MSELQTAARIKPQGCTNLKLRQLMRRVTQHYDDEVGKSGLKGTQYSLLSHVVKLGPVRAVDLATAMKLSTSTLSRNLQPMVAAGWLMIGPGGDARSRIEDTDYSSETTAMAKAQILSQASTAMLAQANQSQQNVLSLLATVRREDFVPPALRAMAFVDTQVPLMAGRPCSAAVVDMDMLSQRDGLRGHADGDAGLHLSLIHI